MKEVPTLTLVDSKYNSATTLNTTAINFPKLLLVSFNSTNKQKHKTINYFEWPNTQYHTSMHTHNEHPIKTMPTLTTNHK